MMTEFKNKHGTHIPDDGLPAQSCFEHFIGKLADGTLKEGPLSLIVSAVEEEQRDAKKPAVSMEHNLQLDSRLTISTKRRHTSTEPADEIALRAKYSSMTYLWLLTQMKQPGRAINEDFDRCTITDFLDKLLDRDNFHFYKEVDGLSLHLNGRIF